MLPSVNIELLISEEGKIKSQPLVYAASLYFTEELNGGHTEVDIGSLLGYQTVFEYNCLRSVYSCGRWELYM